MKVHSYLQTVPSLAKAKQQNSEKVLLLRYFAEGVSRVGDIGIISEKKLVDDTSSDVGVIQGWVHNRVDTPHLKLRHQLIQHYKQANKRIITADANLFLYKNKNNPGNYLRYSFDGIFPSTGEYCDSVIDPARWQQISKQLNITPSYKYTQNRGTCILFCLQRNGGWSMRGLELIDWILRTIRDVQQHTDRPIILRAHPGDKMASQYLKDPRINSLKNVIISQPNNPLEQELQNTWAVVNHNSSSIVGPLIQGYPAFITDPENSQCSKVSHHRFDKIENPDQFDIQEWLERISMFHWNFEELRNGSCWKHMREFI